MSGTGQITVLSREGQAEYKEKGSRFLGFAFFIGSEAMFQSRLQSLKRQYFDATHHCFAWRLHPAGFKYADDGEPGGTAGIRIFGAIEQSGVTNCGVVIVRYYGGTKLGTGPLGKAYADTAKAALLSAAIVRQQLYTITSLSFTADDTGTAYHLLKKYNIRIEGTGGEEQIVLEISGTAECMDNLQRHIHEHGMENLLRLGNTHKSEYRSA